MTRSEACGLMTMKKSFRDFTKASYRQKRRPGSLSYQEQLCGRVHLLDWIVFTENHLENL